jgi:hypothetical protein
MPVLSPLAKDVHVNKPLTNILIGYHNSAYIADEIFPNVVVNKQTDIIPAIKKSAFFRDEAATPLGEAETAASIGYEVDTSATYYCDRYGARHFISDDRRVNEDDPFDSDREASMLVTDKLAMRREKAWVADFWKKSVWTTDVTGGTTVNKWSDYGSSSPIENMRTYRRTIRRLLGRNPNTLVLGDLTYDVLVDHPDILERIIYTERGIATEQLLSALFNVDRVLVGESVSTATAEGVAEASVSYTANWDDDALLMYVAPRPSIWEPSAGYTFVWNTGLGNGMQWVRKYRNEEILGDFIEVRSYFDQKATVADAGVFFSDIVD